MNIFVYVEESIRRFGDACAFTAQIQKRSKLTSMAHTRGGTSHAKQESGAAAVRGLDTGADVLLHCLFALELLGEVRHHLLVDERVDVLAQLVQDEPIAYLALACNRLDLVLRGEAGTGT